MFPEFQEFNSFSWLIEEHNLDSLKTGVPRVLYVKSCILQTSLDIVIFFTLMVSVINSMSKGKAFDLSGAFFI